MRNFFKLFGIIATVAVIGFSMSACSDSDDNGGGGVPSNLIGTWDHEDGSQILDFRSDGLYVCNSTTEPTYKMEGIRFSGGNTMTLVVAGHTIGEVTYSVSGNTLTITGDGILLIPPGVYTRR